MIQEKEFQPLGSNDTIKVDVRILAATNDDLRKLVDEGRFRQDLYYRLNVINIALPPLRERKEDIPPLVDFSSPSTAGRTRSSWMRTNHSMLRFQPEAMQVLMDHNWPGNVRELENVVERAVVLASEPAVPLDVFPDHLLQASGIRLHRDEGGPSAGGRIAIRDRGGLRAPHHYRSTWSRPTGARPKPPIPCMCRFPR